MNIKPPPTNIVTPPGGTYLQGFGAGWLAREAADVPIVVGPTPPPAFDIQAAVDATAPGGTLLFPAEAYIVGRVISIKKPLTVQGVSPQMYSTARRMGGRTSVATMFEVASADVNFVNMFFTSDQVVPPSVDANAKTNIVAVRLLPGCSSIMMDHIRFGSVDNGVTASPDTSGVKISNFQGTTEVCSDLIYPDGADWTLTDGSSDHTGRGEHCLRVSGKVRGFKMLRVRTLNPNDKKGDVSIRAGSDYEIEDCDFNGPLPFQFGEGKWTPSVGFAERFKLTNCRMPSGSMDIRFARNIEIHGVIVGIDMSIGHGMERVFARSDTVLADPAGDAGSGVLYEGCIREFYGIPDLAKKSTKAWITGANALPKYVTDGGNNTDRLRAV